VATELTEAFYIYAKTGVTNLGYMFPKGYLCLFQGVHFCTVARNF